MEALLSARQLGECSQDDDITGAFEEEGNPVNDPVLADENPPNCELVRSDSAESGCEDSELAQMSRMDQTVIQTPEVEASRPHKLRKDCVPMRKSYPLRSRQQEVSSGQASPTAGVINSAENGVA